MKRIFKKPSLIGIVGNPNSGKSNLIYHIIETLRKDSDFNLVTYGLKYKQGQEIFSLDELEQAKNSIIIIDECLSLFELNNRAKKEQIETTLRLIFHNNNIIILSLLPENCKKFLSSKFTTVIFKKSTLPDFINGSMIKRIVNNYKGAERGNTILDIPINQALIFDGKSYNIIDVDYYEKFDSKRHNSSILKQKPSLKRMV